jgi:hypothetical protein
MSLLRELIKENGATSAGSIAGAHGSLFGGGAVANTNKSRKGTTAINVAKKPKGNVPMIRRITQEGDLYAGGLISFERIKKAQFTALQRAMMFEDITGSTDFDVSDVISKLEAAEKKAKVEKDTTTFGLENENGGIVRVVVRQDQADEFEQALSQMLAGSDSNNDDENTSMEIAEVLFKLKDKYDIVDVDWGDIPEDEEQEQTVGGGDAGGGAPAGGAAGGGLPPPGGAPAGGQPPAGGENPIDQAASEEGAEGEGEGEEGEDDGEMEAGGDEEDSKSALDAVISMMKADAKAKMAEANARAAEARAKEAEWTAKASASKVKQEEEVLDMETHEKEQRDMDKEAKRLAKLAKYRHEKASKYGEELHSGGDDDNDDYDRGDHGSEEEEEGGNRFPYDPADKKRYGPSKRKVNLKQLRDMIYAHLRGDEH